MINTKVKNRLTDIVEVQIKKYNDPVEYYSSTKNGSYVEIEEWLTGPFSVFDTATRHRRIRIYLNLTDNNLVKSLNTVNWYFDFSGNILNFVDCENHYPAKTILDSLEIKKPWIQK